MPTKDELLDAIEDARKRAEMAERSAHKTQGPYRDPCVRNIQEIQEVLDEVLR